MKRIDRYPHNIDELYLLRHFKGVKKWSFKTINKQKNGQMYISDRAIRLEYKVNRDQIEEFKKNIRLTSKDGDLYKSLLFGGQATEDPFTAAFGRREATMSQRPYLALFQSGKESEIGVTVNDISGRLPGISQYLNVDMLDFDHSNMKFKNELPRILELEMSDNLTIELTTRVMISPASTDFKAEIDSFVKLTYKKATLITAATDDFDKIEAFFNFIFSAISSNHIFIIENWPNKKKDGSIRYALLPYKHVENPRVEHRYQEKNYLFESKDINNTATTLFNWMTEYVHISDAADALKLLKTSVLSEDLRFTTLINALESLHRRFMDRTKEPSQNYKSRVQRILESINNEDDKAIVKASLTWGNELNLRTRLTDLFAYCESVGLDTFSPEELTKIKNTRNYLVHGTLRLKAKKMTVSDLYDVNRRLAKVMKVYAMHLIGISDEELKKIIKKSSAFNQYYRDEPNINPAID